MNMHDILRRDPEIWDLFSRKEEYGNPHRDQYDRFPYYASKDRYIFEPKASQYLIAQGYSIDYPDNASFAVCLTHDIDEVYHSVISKGMGALRHLEGGNLAGAVQALSQIWSKKLPFCNFSEIMDLEEKYGATSTFFIMSESPGESSYGYSIEDLAPEIGEITDRGWDVGLHGGDTSYLDPQEMKRKKVQMERVLHRPVTGYRNHFLRFRVPDTWEYLSQAGFLYDATFGYADCAGFRNGMCHPFRPFNLNKNHEIDILEIPLTIMDVTMDSLYMRLDDKTKWEFIKMLIDRVINCQGVFTLLWHNTYMRGDNIDLYEKILQYCNDRKAWMTSGDRVSSFLIDRGYS